MRQIENGMVVGADREWERLHPEDDGLCPYCYGEGYAESDDSLPRTYRPCSACRGTGQRRKNATSEEWI